MSSGVPWISFRSELTKLVARRRTWAGFGVFVGVEVIVLALLTRPEAQAALAKMLDKNGLALEAAFTAPTLATYILYLTVTLLAGLYLALAAADLVAKEVEDGTMRLVLARPVTRVQIVAGKIGVSVILTFAFIAFIGASALAVAALAGGGIDSLIVLAPTQRVFAFYEGPEALWRYGRAVIVLSITSQAITALGFLFSCLPLRPALATVLTLTVLLTDLILGTVPVLRPYEGWLMTHHLGCWLLTFEYVVPWTRIAESLIYLGAISTSCWVVGALAFCDRDLR